MPTKDFSLSWIKSRESYDLVSRSKILTDLYKKNKEVFRNIVDLGGGTGSFLRWCHYKNIEYDKFLITDHDQKLLNRFFIMSKNYFSKENIKLYENNVSSYILERKNKQKTSIINLRKQEILKTMESINNYNLISFSAISDLLSKDYIKKLLNKINRGKYIYFSICFDGRVKWNNSNKYDKYIISMFNKHQLQEKTLGMALGSNSIKIIREMSLKKDYKVTIADSSWVLPSDARDFQMSYLNTIYKPLKKSELVDSDILKEWFIMRSNDIELKKSRVSVGHKDILIKT